MPRNFDFGKIFNPNQEERNDNRGQNQNQEQPPPGKSKLAMEDMEAIDRGNPPEEVLNWLDGQDDETLRRFASLIDRARAGFEPGTPTPDDLAFLTYVFAEARKAPPLSDEERARQAGERMARETERYNRRQEVAQANRNRIEIDEEGRQRTTEDMSDEEINREYERIRRERRERRRAREARQQEERLYPEVEFSPDGRIRKITGLRKIGNQTLDPITRLYKLNPIYNSPRDELYRARGRRDYGRVAINKPGLDRLLDDKEFTSSEDSIAVTKVDWSLGGYQDEEELIPAVASRLSDDSHQRWNGCFSSQNGNFEPVEITPATLEARQQIHPNNRSNPELLFTENAGGAFGQSEAFNFASRMNILANEALPNPRQILSEEELQQKLNVSFSHPPRGSAWQQTALTRFGDMLRAMGHDGNIGQFWRSFAERFPDQGVSTERTSSGPDNELTGYETYQKLFLFYNLTRDSAKDRTLIMVGLRNGDARSISEQTFVSYEFYNFEAYTGLARDLFGHQLSKTEGDLNSDVFGYIDPEYNYFFPEYENAVAGSNVPHLLLPNFYTYIMASSDSIPNSDPPDFLGGERQSTLRNQAIQQITLGEFSNNILPSLMEGDLSNYLREYSNSIEGGVTTNISTQLTNLYRNIGLPADQVDLFDRLNMRASSFPMTIKIGIPTGPIGSLGAMIERTGTSTSMTNLLVDSSGQSELFNFACNAYESPTTSGDPFDIERPENQPQAANLAIETPTVVYDFDTWIANIENTNNNIATLTTGDGQSYRAGGERLPNELITLSDSHYINNLKLAVEARAQEQTITYRNLISKNFDENNTYSETFMYKLKKFTTAIDGGEPRLINEFYIPNTQLSRIIEYVDTQIKYNETYYYELFGFNIVFGSEYRFRTREASSSGGAWNQNSFSSRPLYYSFNVETLPSVKVVEYPIFSNLWESENLSEAETSGGGVKYPIVRIIDRPPVVPNVFASPLKDNFRQIMFNFQPMVDFYIDKYISLSIADERRFEQISRTQKIQENYDLKRGEVEFNNEGLQEIKSIEVYRSEEIAEFPMSTQELYDSFRDKLHKVVLNSEGLDFLDTLEPNKTYYYTFRTVDRHNQISNPTQIYEINLSYSSGVFIPRIELYNPEDNLVKTKTPSKKMARFIEIKSADIQNQVYDEFSEGQTLIRSRKGLIEDQEERVTTNKFLIRLTSKDSGKKISFLIDFKER
jgi:hypothetical protein